MPSNGVKSPISSKGVESPRSVECGGSRTSSECVESPESGTRIARFLPGKILQRIMSSTFALTALFLFALDYFAEQIKPLRFFNHTGLTTINQNFLVAKLPIALNESGSADVLLMGTSLALFPAVRCDDEFHSVKTRYDRWYLRNHLFEYNRADYFAKLLSDRLHRQVNVLNLSVAGGMMSDQYLILKKYLSSGKRPGLVVCTVGPRDFLDNERSVVEKTPTYSVLADFTSIGDAFSKRLSFQEFCDLVISMAFHFYKERSDYATFATNLASRLSGHATTMYTATQGKKVEQNETNLSLIDSSESVIGLSKPDYGPRVNHLDELDHYKKMYLPVNESLFQTQARYLDKFLKLAKEEQLPVVLVEMPVTEPNFKLLPEEMQKRYHQLLVSAAETYGARFCSPEAAVPFGLNDFEDCAHLNASGGKKVFKAIAEQLNADEGSRSVATKKSKLGLAGWSLF